MGETSVGRRIGRFAVFWGASPTSANEHLPWIATLAVHGPSIACLLFGLGTLALETRGDPRARTMFLGIGVTMAGILTASLLIPIGMESAAPMSSGEIAWFQVSVALTAAGLIALGRRDRLESRG